MTESTTPPLSERALSEIEARANAATPEPWRTTYVGDCSELWRGKRVAQFWGGQQEVDDTEFTAHARTDIPRLLAALRASEEAAAEMRRPLIALLAQWRVFTENQGGWGNQEDAYYALAKHAQEQWQWAAEALNSSDAGASLMARLDAMERALREIESYGHAAGAGSGTINRLIGIARAALTAPPEPAPSSEPAS